MKPSNVLTGLCLLLAACSSSSTKETSSGFKYTVLREGDGVTGRPGQFIVFNFVLKDSKDSVWIDTYERGYPEMTAIPDSMARQEADGITEMIQMLSKGDSVTFQLSVTELFRDFVKAPVPPYIDSTRHLNYTFSMEEIMDKEAFTEYQAKMEEEYRAKEEKKATEQLAKDTVAIDNYLKEQGISANRLPSGVRYIITKNGAGNKVESGKTVMVNYAGYLLDGTYFDTSVESIAHKEGIYDSLRASQFPYQPMEVTVDQSRVIKGWHVALKQLNEGGAGTFYIPSSLAYGPTARSEKIKENAILVFDIEVVDMD